MKKDPPGIGLQGTDRCPVGFSADVLVGARHDLHMQVHPRPHVRPSIRQIRIDSIQCFPIQGPRLSSVALFKVPRMAPLSRTSIHRS